MNLRRSGALATLMVSALVVTGCSNARNLESNNQIDTSNLTGVAGELRGEGASSQQKAMELFGVNYASAVSGAALAYNATGSGAGQKQFIAGQVDFGGSDSALKEEQVEAAAQRCKGNEAWHLPMVVGPVAVAYNIAGVDSVNLTTELIAKIFKGEVNNWSDPAIQEANPETELPDLGIRVLYRAEESGTSDNFQKFLKATAPDVWEAEGKSFPTDVGSGAQGSSGVTDQVKATNGAITYVESGFAKASGLGIANIDFGQGPVELSSESVNNALSHVTFKTEGHNMVVDTSALYKMQEPGAYPLALTTYEIVCSAGYEDKTRDMVKDFLHVVIDSQNDDLALSGYVPVDGEFKQRLIDAVNAIS